MASYTGLDLGLNTVENEVVGNLSAMETAIEGAIAAASSDDELTTGEALELQYELAKWSLLYEAASNMGKKIDDAVANTVANLR